MFVIAEEQTTATATPIIPVHQTAIRYWTIGDGDELIPPISPGNFNWVPGVNQSHPYGLYGFRYDPSLTTTYYFDVRKGTFAGEMFEHQVIGGMAYWGNEEQAVGGRMVVATFAAVACLLEYPKMSRSCRRRIHRAARRYRVEVVGIGELVDAVDRYIQETLPQFDITELVAKIK